MERLGVGAFPSFHVEGRAAAEGSPDAAAFPAGVGIVDATVHPLCVEAQGVGHAHSHPLSVFEHQQGVALVAGVDGEVFPKTQGVELVYPSKVAAFGAAGPVQILELRQGLRVEAPALGAVLAGGLGTVQGAHALAAVEAGHVAAGYGRPGHAVAGSRSRGRLD